MSAPETTSKGRPSLLSETAPGVPDSSSRILASLEGRVSAQQLPRRRSSKKPLAAVALAAAIGAGAFGAWQWQRAQNTPHPTLAGVDRSHTAPAALGASGAGATAKAAQSGPAAASTPQAAVIVADDPSSSSASASASAPAADPLSRALASGVVASTDKPASVPSADAASGSKSVAKVGAGAPAPATARNERDNAKSRREKLAAAHPAKRAKGHASGRPDDPDADLLAVLVARTKPYDSHAPVAASGAKGVSAAHPASLAAQIKQCDKSNFFEAQLCRWRACSDHWGKDPACPSANSTAQTR
ncbi:phage tail protein [Trinickia sp. NRRL B-1857]|uniref:phage tail protein n=1 Tax=Trinickia sp. NRRL B-1857 TaxID=3162879 RepID=UPI003D27F1BD